MLIINFEGREAKGLSKGRYDETFAGEDAKTQTGHRHGPMQHTWKRQRYQHFKDISVNC